MAKRKKGMDAASYKSIGVTRDGVTILKPKTKPSHFTTREIRSTIKQVLSELHPPIAESNPRSRQATKT